MGTEATGSVVLNVLHMQSMVTLTLWHASGVSSLDCVSAYAGEKDSSAQSDTNGVWKEDG